MSMPRLTLLLALTLIVLGVGSWLVTGRESITALIPAFFGVPFALLALRAEKEGARKLAMHLAATLALIGIAGTVTGVVKTVKMLAGAEIARPPAAIAQTIMCALCLTFLILCVRSFVKARRAPNPA